MENICNKKVKIILISTKVCFSSEKENLRNTFPGRICEETSWRSEEEYK